MLQKLKNYYHLLQSFVFNVIYRFPSRKVKVIGVTGTDGKTTTTSMIYHVLKENGFKVGMMSTIMAKYQDEEIDVGLHVTTPEPWDLPKIMRQLVDKGMEYIVIESTSSGLDQNRLFGIEYDAVTITNIGHDHLDYHKTWQNYAEAKYKIIEKTKPGGLVVLNEDHESSDWLKSKVKGQKLNVNSEWYSLAELKNKNHSVEGISFSLVNTAYSLNLIGEYNFSNALGVIKICRRYLDDEKISDALKSFESPMGRMQVIQTKPYTVIVDFAHTPSSLEMALKSVNDILPSSSSRVISVFGCAGQRDHDRRKMGAVSAELADVTIVTLEDPRTENIEEINDEIIKYAKQQGGKVIERFKSHKEFNDNKKVRIEDGVENNSIYSFDYSTIENRKDAVELAMRVAKEDDIVFVTGKGHEVSLAIVTDKGEVEEVEYSDQETIKYILDR